MNHTTNPQDADETARLHDVILEREAEIATLRDLLGKENQRANAAIDREETAEQAAIEAQQELGEVRADRATLLRAAEAPTDWIDGHPQLEAIAAAVWERCEHHDSGLIIDDPRNIAVAALAALLPAPADGPSRLADEAQQPTDQDVVEAHRLALSFALDLGTGAPWDAIQERAEHLSRVAAEEQPAETQAVDRSVELAAVLREVLATFAPMRETSDGPVAYYDGSADIEPEQFDRWASALDGIGPCACIHPADEHSVYGCADGCGCEWMPKRPAVGEQPDRAVPLRAELKPWQLLTDAPVEPLPQTERLVGGRRLKREAAQPAVTEQPDTQTREAFVPLAHYRGRDGTAYCVHATPVGPDSCRHCRELAE